MPVPGGRPAPPTGLRCAGRVHRSATADGKLERHRAIKVTDRAAAFAVPARSVTSLEVKGLSGVADDGTHLGIGTGDDSAAQRLAAGRGAPR
ncbi:hypothetical protein [Streptomyces sp. NPDC048584]|uniref:hypothetical protein n=1 Tax=Streptomyces sp. NPDC048584 TaxID=3365573 RepID=UPI00372103C7